MKKLTERQRRVLEFIGEYAGRRGYPPTVREIGAHFGFLWAAARMHLKALENKGFLRLSPGLSRGIEIMPSGSVPVPVMGGIRAGKPVLVVKDIDAHIVIDRSLFPQEDIFSLRVRGDSMVGAGILDGDYVLVRPQSAVEGGDIGVVLVGDEATVKRVFFEDDKIILKPENESMSPVAYGRDEINIIGKVTGVVRKL